MCGWVCRCGEAGQPIDWARFHLVGFRLSYIHSFIIPTPTARTHQYHQEQFYDALDGAQGLVDTYIVRSGDSEAEQRRLQVGAPTHCIVMPCNPMQCTRHFVCSFCALDHPSPHPPRPPTHQEATQAALRRRRAANSALKAKDKILTVLDYSLHPGKAWHDLVAAPLSEARERDRAKKAARRRGLVQALQRYQAAKSRFYDTLDLVQESTRVGWWLGLAGVCFVCG